MPVKQQLKDRIKLPKNQQLSIKRALAKCGFRPIEEIEYKGRYHPNAVLIIGGYPFIRASQIEKLKDSPRRQMKRCNYKKTLFETDDRPYSKCECEVAVVDVTEATKVGEDHHLSGWVELSFTLTMPLDKGSKLVLETLGYETFTTAETTKKYNTAQFCDMPLPTSVKINHETLLSAEEDVEANIQRILKTAEKIARRMVRLNGAIELKEIVHADEGIRHLRTPEMYFDNGCQKPLFPANNMFLQSFDTGKITLEGFRDIFEQGIEVIRKATQLNNLLARLL